MSEPKSCKTKVQNFTLESLSDAQLKTLTDCYCKDIKKKGSDPQSCSSDYQALYNTGIKDLPLFNPGELIPETPLKSASPTPASPRTTSRR